MAMWRFTGNAHADVNRQPPWKRSSGPGCAASAAGNRKPRAAPEPYASPEKSPAGAGPEKSLGRRPQATTGCTPAACAPFGPWVTSYWTRWPSCKLRKPLESIAEKWTNTSALPSSGAMNPNPFASLNHFTVPYCMTRRTSWWMRDARRGVQGDLSRPASMQTHAAGLQSLRHDSAHQRRDSRGCRGDVGEHFVEGDGFVRIGPGARCPVGDDGEAG